MSGCCDEDVCNSGAGGKPDATWRRVLIMALCVNASMFVVELAAGLAAGSSALQADALDFLADAANYAISLGVAGLALSVRALAAMLKGATLLALGVFVVGSAGWRAWAGDALPHVATMGVVGFMALIANAGVALMLFRYRRGDANMRSVWICSRNDALGNIAVMLAALGVLGTGTLWPDLIVAGVIAGLAISGGSSIMRQAYRELRSTDLSVVGVLKVGRHAP
jgi:Co/Zn/Cd efflux system component